MAKIPRNLSRIVADLIVQQMMAADRVDEQELLSLLANVAERLRENAPGGRAAARAPTRRLRRLFRPAPTGAAL